MTATIEAIQPTVGMNFSYAGADHKIISISKNVVITSRYTTLFNQSALVGQTRWDCGYVMDIINNTEKYR